MTLPTPSQILSLAAGPEADAMLYRAIGLEPRRYWYVEDTDLGHTMWCESETEAKSLFESYPNNGGMRVGCEEEYEPITTSIDAAWKVAIERLKGSLTIQYGEELFQVVVHYLSPGRSIHDIATAPLDQPALALSKAIGLAALARRENEGVKG